MKKLINTTIITSIIFLSIFANNVCVLAANGAINKTNNVTKTGILSIVTLSLIALISLSMTYRDTQI